MSVVELLARVTAMSLQSRKASCESAGGPVQCVSIKRHWVLSRYRPWALLSSLPFSVSVKQVQARIENR